MKFLPFKIIDNASLIVFRFFFGFLVSCETFGALLTGWVKTNLINPPFTFNFIGFDWLQNLRGDGLYICFFVMGILGIFIMIGFHYRKSIITFTILWTLVYFMQKTAYNNHYYLLLIISVYMVFLPANSSFSFDARKNPKTVTNVMPQWIIYIFIIQIAIVYFYATLAKIYPDWLDGTVTKNLFEGRTDIDYINFVFSKKWFHLGLAYLGILFDLLVIPMFCFKKTRTFALITSLFFHLFNAITLQIGIFPFFALSFALFFYDPKDIRKWFLNNKFTQDKKGYSTVNNKLFVYLFVPFLIVQAFLPLRHYLIKGDVLWTEEGHRLSWRMMLRERNGFISFKIIDNITKQEMPFIVNDLSPKDYSKIATQPDFLWQYCQRIKNKFKGKNISIYVHCENSINRKAYQKLIDPNFDMAKADWNYFWHNNWILLH